VTTAVRASRHWNEPKGEAYRNNRGERKQRADDADHHDIEVALPVRRATHGE